jgi:hypothetical protein
VRGKQPIKVGGYAGAGRKEGFLRWARKRLDGAELLRVKEIDRRYTGAARSAGLMSDEDALDGAMGGR